MLAHALRRHAEQHRDGDADTHELILVLARIVEGKPVAKAFGAPGDWGYETPIGRAMASSPAPPAHFNEADCGGAFDGTRVISDADPGL